MAGDLIDKIYEAAFLPDLWPDVISGLGRISGSVSGALLVFDGTMPIGFRATELAFDTIRDFCTTNAWQESRRIQHFYSNPMSGFAVGSEYFTPEIVEEDERLLRLKSLGFKENAGTIIPMPTGEIVGFALHRRAEDGFFQPAEIAALNELYPHLARSGLMSARLRLEQARATVQALHAIGLPAAVMTNAGRVLSTNGLFDAMTSTFKPAAYGGLVIADVAANRLLQQAVATAHADHAAIVRSIPVAAAGDSPAIIVHVLPLRRSAHDVFSGADILVVASAMSASNMVPSPNILMGLFDLTPAEAKLAIALTAGRSVKDAALENGVTVKTSQTYLARIFAKTGTHQQSQLVALLKSAQPLNGSS